MMLRTRWLAALLSLAFAQPVSAYPLDASEDTHIYRLEAFFLAQEPLLANGRLMPGSLLPQAEVRPRLLEHRALVLPESDPAFLGDVLKLLGDDVDAYGIAVLDLSDPANPRYAEHNGRRAQNPASVGKLVIALSWFQTLADVYPDDVEARKRLLLDTIVTANEFIVRDTHTVPVWKPGDPKIVSRPIEQGDEANLYTFFDWMCSASSNAAAAQMQEQLMLLKQFGKSYPVSAEQAAKYFSETPKKELSAQFLELMRSPLKRSGLDSREFLQGGFFTRTGKAKVPGTTSTGSARAFTQYMLLMEQGKLVDEWSSGEIKRLLYLTDRRIRYASTPVLGDSAVYYKSGSLYSCKPEEGFTCGKYEGNRYNYLNSVVVVETEKDGRRLHYIVGLVSNVLRKNSAWVHRILGGEIHKMIEAAHPPPESGEGVPPAPQLVP